MENNVSTMLETAAAIESRAIEEDRKGNYKEANLLYYKAIAEFLLAIYLAEELDKSLKDSIEEKCSTYANRRTELQALLLAQHLAEANRHLMENS